MTSASRSAGTVEAVCENGIVAPGLSFSGDLPGLQSMKYSPISDCGRDSQKTSERREPNPCLGISKSTSAFLFFGSTRSLETFPARTPATLTSPPLTSPKALSNSTVKVLPDSSFAPVEVSTYAPAAARSRVTSRIRLTSLPREHLRRVAGEVGGGLEGVGPVVGPVLAAARAAVVLAALERRLERLAPQLGRDELELPRASGPGEREGVGVDGDAPDGPERVVDAGVAEVVEPAQQVGGVGPEEGELGRVALERVPRGLERAVAQLAVRVDLAGGDVAKRDLQLGQLDQVVGVAGPAHDVREVPQRRARVAGERAQLGQERPQLLRDGLGLVHERVEVVEGGAQVHERRVGAAHERREAGDRLGQRLLLVADGGRRGGELVDEAREVLAAVGDVRDELRGGDDEALEQRGVAVELAEQPARGGERGVEIGDARVELLALPLDLPGGALDDARERLAGRGVERVEQLVEVDRRRRRILVDDPAVGDLRGAVGGHAQVDVAVGHAGERRLADGGGRPAAQRGGVLLDAHRDPGLAVRREVDGLDLADRRAAGLDEVALDELRGVLEPGLDDVAAARRAQEEERDRYGHDDEGGQGRRSNDLIPRKPHSQFLRSLQRSPHFELAVIRDRGHTVMTGGGSRHAYPERAEG